MEMNNRLSDQKLVSTPDQKLVSTPDQKLVSTPDQKLVSTRVLPQLILKEDYQLIPDNLKHGNYYVVTELQQDQLFTWNRGKREGTHILKFPDYTEQSQWKDDLNQGPFTRTYNDRMESGIYVNDKRDGLVTTIYTNGSILKQLFKDGILQLKQRFDEDGDQFYSCEYKDGLKDGLEEYFNNRDPYLSEFNEVWDGPNKLFKIQSHWKADLRQGEEKSSVRMK